MNSEEKMNLVADEITALISKHKISGNDFFDVLSGMMGALIQCAIEARGTDYGVELLQKGVEDIVEAAGGKIDVDIRKEKIKKEAVN